MMQTELYRKSLIRVICLQSKLTNELQKKNGQLRKTVAELDQVAQEQLHALADQSQTAISATQTKLLQANNQVQQLTQFVKVRIRIQKHRGISILKRHFLPQT